VVAAIETVFSSPDEDLELLAVLIAVIQVFLDPL
jgi:hypothetical protein